MTDDVVDRAAAWQKREHQLGQRPRDGTVIVPADDGAALMCPIGCISDSTGETVAAVDGAEWVAIDESCVFDPGEVR